MSDSTNTKPEKPDQDLVGFMSNDEWDELLNEVDGLVQEMEDLPYPQVKERIFLLLAGIDTIHREGLRRLVRLFKEGVLEKVVTDPAIHTLMELYDMLPPEAKETKPHGSNIQWTTSAAKKPSEDTFIPPATPSYPHWEPVMGFKNDLENGEVREIQIENHRILICRAKDTYFAIASACIRDNASLAEASLVKLTLTCPNHDGCYYDIRGGGQIGGTSMLECYPIKREDNGRLMIGIDMVFKPELPAF